MACGAPPFALRGARCVRWGASGGATGGAVALSAPMRHTPLVAARRTTFAQAFLHTPRAPAGAARCAFALAVGPPRAAAGTAQRALRAVAVALAPRAPAALLRTTTAPSLHSPRRRRRHARNCRAAAVRTRPGVAPRRSSDAAPLRPAGPRLCHRCRRLPVGGMGGGCNFWLLARARHHEAGRKREQGGRQG